MQNETLQSKPCSVMSKPNGINADVQKLYRKNVVRNFMTRSHMAVAYWRSAFLRWINCTKRWDIIVLSFTEMWFRISIWVKQCSFSLLVWSFVVWSKPILNLLCIALFQLGETSEWSEKKHCSFSRWIGYLNLCRKYWRTSTLSSTKMDPLRGYQKLVVVSDDCRDRQRARWNDEAHESAKAELWYVCTKSRWKCRCVDVPTLHRFDQVMRQTEISRWLQTMTAGNYEWACVKYWKDKMWNISFRPRHAQEKSFWLRYFLSFISKVIDKLLKGKVFKHFKRTVNVPTFTEEREKKCMHAQCSSSPGVH